MNEIKNLLINNWQLILAVIIFILSFILQLFKKKPIENMVHLIFRASIDAINDSELFSMVDPNYLGKQKLAGAVDYVKRVLHARYPQLNVDVYEATIIDVIELILSTPQKKGGNTDAK